MIGSPPRYIYICHPTTAKTWCTIPKVNRTIAALFLATVTIQISRFFDTNYGQQSCWSEMVEPDSTLLSTEENPLTNLSFSLQTINGTLFAKQDACISSLAEWTSMFPLYFPLYFVTRIIFVNLGPCIALVILNVLLFKALQVSTQPGRSGWTLVRHNCAIIHFH